MKLVRTFKINILKKFSITMENIGWHEGCCMYTEKYNRNGMRYLKT